VKYGCLCKAQEEIKNCTLNSNISYVDFCDGFIQVPTKEAVPTKSQLTKIYQTDFRAIARIIDDYFPIVLSLKQVSLIYADQRIDTWDDDGYLAWFLTLCLGRYFRFPGTNKINHKKLKTSILLSKPAFSWEMFKCDKDRKLPSEEDILKNVGVLRYTESQIINEFDYLQEIKGNEKKRTTAKSRTAIRSSSNSNSLSTFWD
jgi:hypothetical protein